MRVVIQRVSSASVTIDRKVKSTIANGLMILLGIESADDQNDITWLVKKIVNLRIFNDDQERMNLSISDVDGDILLISQFTLHAYVKKGNRPSYIKAAHPDVAIPLYNKFIDELELSLNKKIYSGEFGAMMEVALVNDGPVTIIIDSKSKE
jgi:D-tyrosyl-tRNA(Tyr) deacylase